MLRKADGERHELLCFVAGKSEYHALITGAGVVFVARCALLCFQRFIHAQSDIRRLLVYRGENAAGVAVEALGAVVISDFAHGFSRDFLNVRIGVRGDLAHDHYKPGGAAGLAGDTGVRVGGKNGIEHGIGYLVADLIGMPFGYRFACEKTFHRCVFLLYNTKYAPCRMYKGHIDTLLNTSHLPI